MKYCSTREKTNFGNNKHSDSLYFQAVIARQRPLVPRLCQGWQTLNNKIQSVLEHIVNGIAIVAIFLMWGEDNINIPAEYSMSENIILNVSYFIVMTFCVAEKNCYLH